MAKIGKCMLLKLQGKHCYENRQITDSFTIKSLMTSILSLKIIDKCFFLFGLLYIKKVWGSLWLERPTGVVESHGFDSPQWATQKIYSLSNST